VSEINIIDASAILAYLQQEKGQETVEAALDAHLSLMTTVNYCEVLSKLCEKGMPPGEAQAAVNDIGVILVDFDPDLAFRAAAMRPRTSHIGASLGDRACLALAQKTADNGDHPILFTAEHLWLKLKWPFKIVAIRASRGVS
jgi:PIN domain nuclease of toxin-antitoxin system